MSTYTVFDSSIPINRRANLVTDIEAGDQLNMYEILGRPANKIVVSTSSASDIVEFRMNNLVRRFRPIEEGPSELVEIWLGGDDVPLYSAEGTDYILGEGLQIHSLEIVTLTLSVGTTIQMSVQ